MSKKYYLKSKIKQRTAQHNGKIKSKWNHGGECCYPTLGEGLGTREGIGFGASLVGLWDEGKRVGEMLGMKRGFPVVGMALVVGILVVGLVGAIVGAG